MFLLTCTITISLSFNCGLNCWWEHHGLKVKRLNYLKGVDNLIVKGVMDYKNNQYYITYKTLKSLCFFVFTTSSVCLRPSTTPPHVVVTMVTPQKFQNLSDSDGRQSQSANVSDSFYQTPTMLSIHLFPASPQH